MRLVIEAERLMDWMRYRKIYFILSGVLITIGLFSLGKWGMNLGLDFKGGTIAEYQFEKEISQDSIEQKFKESGLEIFSIETTGANKYLIRMSPLDKEQKEKANKILNELTEGSSVNELRFEIVGPSIGPELIKKTIYAALIASIAILLWVAYQFKSFSFGISAILAMFHDTFILIGSFALMGHYFKAEIDFLFVTALLTTLSFSVHDTIVVYDRIRESQKKYSESIYNLANKAITETMVRSLNNSFTIIFMLVALILLGGTTIKWFAIALFIGTVAGTYSSPFVAVPLLVTWDDIVKKLKFKK